MVAARASVHHLLQITSENFVACRVYERIHNTAEVCQCRGQDERVVIQYWHLQSVHETSTLIMFYIKQAARDSNSGDYYTNYLLQRSTRTPVTPPGECFWNKLNKHCPWPVEKHAFWRLRLSLPLTPPNQPTRPTLLDTFFHFTPSPVFVPIWWTVRT